MDLFLFFLISNNYIVIDKSKTKDQNIVAQDYILKSKFNNPAETMDLLIEELLDNNFKLKHFYRNSNHESDLISFEYKKEINIIRIYKNNITNTYLNYLKNIN